TATHGSYRARPPIPGTGGAGSATHPRAGRALFRDHAWAPAPHARTERLHPGPGPGTHAPFAGQPEGGIGCHPDTGAAGLVGGTYPPGGAHPTLNRPQKKRPLGRRGLIAKLSISPGRVELIR